jgi:hypothetical protein
MTKSVTFSQTPVGWLVGLLPASWNRLKFSAGSGPQEVVLRIGQGTAKKGYRFDQRDPIWVAVDNGQCPQQCGVHGQITDIRCTDTELTFTNLNDEPVTMRYQLNVLDSSNGAKPIDPIMDNGGHGLR